MAKVTGPLGGFDTSGSIAKTITFSKWRGRNYVRQTVKPANPNTIAQQGQRAIARLVSQNYTLLNPTDTASWVLAGKGDNITGLNAWLRDSAKRKPQDLAVRILATGSGGTVPGAPTLLTATGGKGFATLAWTNSVVGTLYATAIHQGATGFTPGPGNLIMLIRSTTATFTLTGLKPGTYFFRVRHSSETGLYGTSAAEASAVVT